MRRRKLILRGETVRALTPSDLRGVQGGVMAESTGVPCLSYLECPTGGFSCQYTDRGAGCWPPPPPMP